MNIYSPGQRPKGVLDNQFIGLLGVFPPSFFPPGSPGAQQVPLWPSLEDGHSLRGRLFPPPFRSPLFDLVFGPTFLSV